MSHNLQRLDLCSAVQLVNYNFAEKYNNGGVIGMLASDRAQLGDIVISNASLGLVTEASVDLMGASCAGVLVCPHLHGSPDHVQLEL